MWQSFKTEIKYNTDKRVPTKMTKPKHTHPWMNTDIRRKMNQKHRAHTKARKRKKKKKTRIDIKDYKQKSSMKSGKQARNT